MIIELDHRCGVPLEAQVADAIALRVLNGYLAPGQALPSVRELSLQLRVNPRVVHEAYRTLHGERLINLPDSEAPHVLQPPAEATELCAGVIRRCLVRVVSNARQLNVPAEGLREAFADVMRSVYEANG